MDGEIKRILNESYERAKTILKAHSKEHKALAEALLKYETLDAEDIKAIMSGNTSSVDIITNTLSPSKGEKIKAVNNFTSIGTKIPI